MSEISPSLPEWPRVLGIPESSGLMRTCPEDFRVDEELGFEADGEGEHLLVHLRKRNRNTDQIARQLARHAGVRARDVSYCGLKDRIAVTTQWFSIWLPGKPDPDWSALQDDVQILTQARHRRKLPRGALRANHFTIVLRDVECDREAMEQRLVTVLEKGVPNYFGEQRFGRGGSNLQSAQIMFEGRRVKDRHLRGLYLSAARSFLFNEVLAARIVDESWNQVLLGEALMLTGSRSYFIAEALDDEIKRRHAESDVQPSGPLWGRGALPSQQEAQALEIKTLAEQAGFREGLEKAGLKQERRALCLSVNDLQWQWMEDDKAIQLRFSLPSGCYATSVLRELFCIRSTAPTL
ncbi:MAG: tRNA pseudouridine(13) synthase TruD [Ectothiorhodospiraceae bacterium]|nr:tRNA pseudouridine(13) synthase TruD [Ectothiorhodospiraceae bacterium]